MEGDMENSLPMEVGFGKDVSPIFAALFSTFIGWLNRNDDDRKRYLGKLRVAVPHWRPSDRAFLLRALETKGKSCKGSYVQRLLKDVGPERFKLIIFGEEKFCNGCGRSSYIGDDRLWACKRCVEEEVRHKARYCNVECQKSDWLKHKAEKHSCETPSAKCDGMTTSQQRKRSNSW